MRFTKQWLAIAASLLLAASTACAGGEDLSGTAGSRDAGGTGLRELTVMETVGMPWAFLQYGIQQGHFQRQGLAVTLESSGGGTVVVPSLLNGEADIAGTSVAAALTAAERDLPLRMIAAGTSTAESTENDFSAIVTAPQSPIRKVEDLAHADIAVNALRNVSDTVVHGILRQHGLGAENVRFVEMPFPDMMPAVQRGDVDAAFVIEPFMTMGFSAGLRPVARPFSQLRPRQQVGTFLMNSQRIQQDPETVRAFREGVRNTAKSVEDDPEAFRAALPHLGQFAPTLARDMKLPHWDVKNDRPSVAVLSDVMREGGFLKERANLDELIWDE